MGALQLEIADQITVKLHLHPQVSNLITAVTSIILHVEKEITPCELRMLDVKWLTVGFFLFCFMFAFFFRLTPRWQRKLKCAIVKQSLRWWLKASGILWGKSYLTMWGTVWEVWGQIFQNAWEMFKVPAEEKAPFFFFLVWPVQSRGNHDNIKHSAPCWLHTARVLRCPGSVGQPGALLTANERTLDATESAESMPGELRRSWWNARSLKLASIIRPRRVLNNSGLVPRLVSHP